MGLSVRSNDWRRSGVPVWTAVLLGCLLRTIQYLGRTSFSFDELSLVLNFERRSLGSLMSRPLDYYQVAPAGFVASVKAANLALGVNELGLRLVPWISAIVAVFLFWRVSSRVLRGGPLLAGLVLFGVSPSLIYFAGDVKQYAGDVAATLLLVLLAVRFDERPGDRKAAIAAGLGGGLALFFSHPAVLTAAALGLILSWHWLRRMPRPSIAPLVWLGTLWAAGAMASGILALRLVGSETNTYMHRFWIYGFAPAPWRSVEALLWVPGQLFDALGYLLVFIAADWTIGRIFVTVCAVLACIGLIALFRKSRWTAALILTPAAAAVLAACARVLPLEGRVALYVGWPLLIAAVAGLEALSEWLPGRTRVAGVALMVVIAGIPTSLVLFVGRPPYDYQERRPVLAELARRREAGDSIFVYYSAKKAMQFYGKRFGLTEWVTGECHREEPRAYFREIDQFRRRPRVWFFYTHAALGYREIEVIRSYFETIGTERDQIPDPFGVRGQGAAAAYLYDLSDPKRLSAATWESHVFPELTSGGPCVFCDGTRIGGP